MNLNNLFNKKRGLRRLAATKEEGTVIESLFGDKRVSIYDEKTGTKQALASLKTPQILHISTHSFYGKSDRSDVDSLLKSALALSEYDAIFNDGDTRGLMSALEFSTLNLFRTELVFFASCQSGMGDIQNLEGVSGLNRGAKMAGAERVISTLWDISATKSIDFTKSFYTYLFETRSGYISGEPFRDTLHYAEALKATKLKMIDLHPYYWAGFIEYGLD